MRTLSLGGSTCSIGPRSPVSQPGLGCPTSPTYRARPPCLFQDEPRPWPPWKLLAAGLSPLGISVGGQDEGAATGTLQFALGPVRSGPTCHWPLGLQAWEDRGTAYPVPGDPQLGPCAASRRPGSLSGPILLGFQGFLLGVLGDRDFVGILSLLPVPLP